MKLPKIAAEDPPDGGAPLPKRPWTMIFNSTPVVMTVVATVLAGLSSSEMSLAQYHRALAAQNQSKAGDQWGFFQAKRIRGMSIQSTIDLLSAQSGSTDVDGSVLLKAAEDEVAGLERLDRLTKQATGAVARNGQPAPAAKALADRIAEFGKVIPGWLGEARKNRETLAQALSKPEVKQAFSYLKADRLPPAATRPLDAPGLSEAMAAVLRRQSEEQTGALVKTIPSLVLQQAIETAEANILSTEQANKPATDALKPLDQVLQRESQLTHEVVRASRPIERALENLPEQPAAAMAELRATGGQIARTVRDLGSDVQEITNDYRIARDGYLLRRYQAEADSNQKTATVYEVQVRKSSQVAEQHRQRSKRFFYCMLAAQAGVTIATFSLAFKYKSALWSLASLAGLGAVSVSVYVYVYM